MIQMKGEAARKRNAEIDGLADDVEALCAARAALESRGMDADAITAEILSFDDQLFERLCRGGSVGTNLVYSVEDPQGNEAPGRASTSISDALERHAEATAKQPGGKFGIVARICSVRRTRDLDEVDIENAVEWETEGVVETAGVSAGD